MIIYSIYGFAANSIKTGTIGIWAFSRYWWQRGGRKVLKSQRDVPLPKILSLAGPGEGYDAVKLLRWKIFTKEHTSLLLQILVILAVTMSCMFAGPLAKISLRSSLTVRPKKMDVLKAWKGGDMYGNSLFDNVKWNDTMVSLDAAEFPHDRLLDYLPPPTYPWTFIPSEWESYWHASCEFHEETVLNNLQASGNGTFYNALEAFPGYRDTYDTSWLDASEFRSQTNENGESIYTPEDGMRMKDVLVWFIIQSDPSIDSRMTTNKGDMKLSISALHVKDVAVLTDDDATQAGLFTWRPIGPVGNASFTRVDCDITKKPGAIESEETPWLWTNDTFSIADAYATMWVTRLSANSTKNATVSPPSPHELFRFYQAYMIAANTWYSRSYSRSVSTWTDTVQLSIACLTLVLILTLLELWLTGRYLWFLRRNKLQLASTCIPDGKIEWMIYNARLAEQTPMEAQSATATLSKDRDYFGRASFGNSLNQEPGVPTLARVYTNKVLKPSRNIPPRIVVQTGNDDNPSAHFDGYKLKQSSSPGGSYQGADSAIDSDCGSSSMAAGETASISGNTLMAQRSRASTVTAGRPPCTVDPVSTVGLPLMNEVGPAQTSTTTQPPAMGAAPRNVRADATEQSNKGTSIVEQKDEGPEQLQGNA
jgi:hypothetical protein